MARYTSPFAALVFVLTCAPACTGGPASDGDGWENSQTPPTTCEDYTGTWVLIGGCPNTTCELTQNACALVVTCENGLTVTGNLTGESAPVILTLGEEEHGCSMIFSKGKSFSLSCGVCYASGSKR